MLSRKCTCSIYSGRRAIFEGLMLRQIGLGKARDFPSIRFEHARIFLGQVAGSPGEEEQQHLLPGMRIAELRAGGIDQLAVGGAVAESSDLGDAQPLLLLVERDLRDLCL